MTTGVVIGLTAVIVAADADGPVVLITRKSLDGAVAKGLPFGPFAPESHRTFELALRDFVTAQTGFGVGYVEQLYTFGDRGRDSPLADMGDGAGAGPRVVSVSYLALTPGRAALSDTGAGWSDWYRFFPWEDWRDGRPGLIDAAVAPALANWADAAGDPERRAARRDRARLAFALDGAPWNEERALDRYELLYEAGLIAEAARDRSRAAGGAPRELTLADADAYGAPMLSDHRRILATAIGRLRAKIKYRPVIFELLEDRFTLSTLQKVAEGIAGVTLHKQNFRRLLLQTGMVEGTGVIESRTGGRPAELFRFRREALRERPIGGVNVPTPRDR